MRKINKNFHYKVIFIILTLFIAITFLFGVKGFAYTISNADEKDDKHYCTATIDDNFAEDQIVVIMNDSAEKVKLYAPLDFPEISLTAIEDLTKSVKDILKK